MASMYSLLVSLSTHSSTHRRHTPTVPFTDNRSIVSGRTLERQKSCHCMLIAHDCDTSLPLSYRQRA